MKKKEKALLNFAIAMVVHAAEKEAVHALLARLGLVCPCQWRAQ